MQFSQIYIYVYIQVCTYSRILNSSAAWTLIFGKFSTEYELILLTTISWIPEGKLIWVEFIGVN